MDLVTIKTDDNVIKLIYVGAKLVGQAPYVEIHNDVDLGRAGDLKKLLREVLNDLEKTRKEYLKPHQTLTRAVNKWFKDGATDSINQAITHVNAKMKGYMVKAEADRKARHAQTLLEVPDDAKDVLSQAIDNGTLTRGQHGSASRARKVWRWRCANFDDVPNQYLSLNEKRINAAVKLGERNIPGIVVYQDIIPFTR